MVRKKKKKKTKPSSNITPSQEQIEDLKDKIDENVKNEIPSQEIIKPIDIPPPPPPPPQALSQEIKTKPENATINFFKDMGTFFNQLGETYEARYSLWEKSDLTIMSILRELRRVNEENSDKFVEIINELNTKLSNGLNEFLIKRNELERYSDTNYKEIAKKFQKTLDLLNFQIREFRLHQMVNELFIIYSN